MVLCMGFNLCCAVGRQAWEQDGERGGELIA